MIPPSTRSFCTSLAATMDPRHGVTTAPSFPWWRSARPTGFATRSLPNGTGAASARLLRGTPGQCGIRGLCERRSIGWGISGSRPGRRVSRPACLPSRQRNPLDGTARRAWLCGQLGSGCAPWQGLSGWRPLRISRHPVTERIAAVRGVLLGAAGFLPLSPAEAHIGRLSGADLAALEVAWKDRGQPGIRRRWRPPRGKTRSRPANHPLVRPLPRQASSPRQWHPVGVARDHAGNPGLRGGTGRGAARVGDESLRSRRRRGSGAGDGRQQPHPLRLGRRRAFWRCVTRRRGLPPVGAFPSAAFNATTRRAARQVAWSAPLGKIGARGAQGLLHLDTTLCQPRRCFECPIAAAEPPSMADNRTASQSSGRES